MIPKYDNVPPAKQAWVLIFVFSVLPFSFGVYSAATSEVPEDMHRANMVVGGMFFWAMFTIGLNALLYRNNKMWQRAKSRLTRQ